MRISERSRVSGVPVATIKYYLREGLLPAGIPTSATSASYDERHVDRLNLIRALVDVGRVPIARVREVVTALEQPPTSWHDLLGAAPGALPPAPGRPGAGPAAPPGPGGDAVARGVPEADGEWVVGADARPAGGTSGGDAAGGKAGGAVSATAGGA